MTANMVPVCSITSSSVMAGDDGSIPISFSATTTWAELETGNSSASPWTMARTITLRRDMERFYPGAVAPLCAEDEHRIAFAAASCASFSACQAPRLRPSVDSGMRDRYRFSRSGIDTISCLLLGFADTVLSPQGEFIPLPDAKEEPCQTHAGRF